MTRSSASPATPEQGDLFEERGTWCGPDAPQPDMGDENLEGLSDNDLVGKIAGATLANVELLCAQIVERGLGDVAVPELRALWNRFKGFGIKSPLPEQQLALETLAAIGSAAAKSAISKILAAPDLPDSLLPLALLAAARAGLNLPQAQVLPWLEHDAPTVRAQAFALIQSSNPPQSTLEIGFSDPDPSVRRAALISAGNLGHGSAKAGLLTEFRKNPTGQIIEAILSVADDDIFHSTTLVFFSAFPVSGQRGDALYYAKYFADKTFNPFVPYPIVAAYFILLTLVIIGVFGLINRRLNRHLPQEGRSRIKLKMNIIR